MWEGAERPSTSVALRAAHLLPILAYGAALAAPGFAGGSQLDLVCCATFGALCALPVGQHGVCIRCLCCGRPYGAAHELAVPSQAAAAADHPRPSLAATGGGRSGGGRCAVAQPPHFSFPAVRNACNL